MKKLNRKGFTLVELLAVIIILAIVVGITIPAVLTTTDNARKKAFQTSVESVADWLDRQAQSILLNYDDVAKTDKTFKNQCVNNGTPKTCTINDALLKAAGVKPANYTVTGSSATYDSETGRYCVKLKGNSTGDYKSADVKNSAACS